MYKVTFPYRVLAKVGVKNMIITACVGGCNFDKNYPAIFAYTDYINYFGTDPHVGIDMPDCFVNMAQKFDAGLREKLIAAAKRVDVKIYPGVHVGRYGPTYQSPAEVKAFSILGASTVGMSLVPEAIVTV